MSQTLRIPRALWREHRARPPGDVFQDHGDFRTMRDQIASELQRQNACLVAHYYVSADIQEVALATGGCVSDSLEMARFGRDSDATTLIVAGVRFMGETAKILSPDKSVLIVSDRAECSLDLGCPADQLAELKKEHPNHVLVAYANTSARVKAMSDWIVTSRNARDICERILQSGQQLIFAPDKNLGQWVREELAADDEDFILWDGACVVHEEFQGEGVIRLKHQYPEAPMLAHPECPQNVLEHADVVGSTTALIQAAKSRTEKVMIVATDRGILHEMRREAPDKRFLVAPAASAGAPCRACARCPWMGLNTLNSVLEVLQNPSETHEIAIDPDVSVQAARPLERMLAFSKARQ